MTQDAELSRLLLRIADEIEAEHFPASAGVVRVAARRLRELPPGPVRTSSHKREEVCIGCGDPIEQKATGRPRKFCGDGRCLRGNPENEIVNVSG